MSSDDQPIKVYEGDLADVVFLRSLMDEARIDVVSAGVFFGAAKEIYVKRRDAVQAHEIIADFDSQRTKRKGDVLRGPW